MKRFIFVALLALAGFAFFVGPSLRSAAASASISRLPAAPLHPAEEAVRFLLGEPATADLGNKLDLWATWYNMPTVRAAEATEASAVPLMGLRNSAISAPLAREDWCNAAMQGSVWVEGADGKPTAYVFIDDKGPTQDINCDAQFGDLSDGIKNATKRARFAAFHHPKGCDVRPIPLMAYRTIAVDADRIPMGTVLYVPALRNHGFWANGELYVHDGYLVASDRGGAIKGNHIDLFIGERDAPPFPDVVKSHAGATFEAYVVPKTDPAAQALKASYAEVCADVKKVKTPKSGKA